MTPHVDGLGGGGGIFFNGGTVILTVIIEMDEYDRSQRWSGLLNDFTMISMFMMTRSMKDDSMIMTMTMKMKTRG